MKGCSCTGSQRRSYSTIFTNKNPITPEVRYLTAKMAALLPFGQAADFLSELLPERPMIRRHALGLVQADPQSEKPIEKLF